MKTLEQHDPPFVRPDPSWIRRARACSLALGFALATGAIGCGNKSGQSPPATPSANESNAVTGATSTINLNKNDQDSCVTYVPETTSIHVGDRINFNTNSSTPITVNIPAGLFSAHDTSIVVSRGTNTTPPSAQRLGTYPLSSSPRACATVTGGGGPSVTVDAGDATPKP